VRVSEGTRTPPTAWTTTRWMWYRSSIEARIHWVYCLWIPPGLLSLFPRLVPEHLFRSLRARASSSHLTCSRRRRMLRRRPAPPRSRSRRVGRAVDRTRAAGFRAISQPRVASAEYASRRISTIVRRSSMRSSKRVRLGRSSSESRRRIVRTRSDSFSVAAAKATSTSSTSCSRLKWETQSSQTPLR
jgi:hypothetical protein